MNLSVVIPARNAAAHLDYLLPSLMPQLLPGDQCVLVDDASTDDTAQVGRRYGTIVVVSSTRGGPAAARNLGVLQTTGEVIVFLDADVVPHAGLLEKIRQHFRESSDMDAVMGSYDTNPFDPGLVSRYRNLLHAYTHRTANSAASTFWAGCGAIRRTAFQAVGGFDAVQFPEPSIEDIELGVRLKRSGGSILLDPTLLVQHRKAWRLGNMVRTDVMQRAIPWSNLILNSGNMPFDLNLKAAQRISAMAATLGLLLLLFIPWAPVVVGIAATALLIVPIALNAPFYSFLASCGGWWFAVRSIPLHLLYFLCSVTGYAVAFIGFHIGKRRS